MKRLDLFQRNKLPKTIAVFIVLLLITFIFVFTVGFKLLLNTSVWVANLFSKNKPQTLNKTTDIYGSIDIDIIPTATNSAEFEVTGSVVNYDLLEFFLNGERVETITVKTSDSFTEKVGDLNEGNNDFYIRALNKETKSRKKTSTYTIFFKAGKPKLDINEPQDNSTTSASEIIVKGSTDKEVFVRIDDLPIVVDANGNFQTSVRLKEGENKISVTATDVAGNIETKLLNVNYQKE